MVPIQFYIFTDIDGAVSVLRASIGDDDLSDKYRKKMGRLLTQARKYSLRVSFRTRNLLFSIF